MSVNNRFAVDQTKVRKYGKFYGGIDFECDNQVSAHVFKMEPNRPPIGEFIIGNQKYSLTMYDLELIEQTDREASETVMKRYRLGMMGRLD